jgi:RNA recognition motif-containing protein
VEMSSKDEATKAIQTLDGTDLKGRNIKVNEARPKEGGFGGGNGGGNRGGGAGRG